MTLSKGRFSFSKENREGKSFPKPNKNISSHKQFSNISVAKPKTKISISSNNQISKPSMPLELEIQHRKIDNVI